MIVEERKNITANGTLVRGSLLSYQLDTYGFYGRTESENICLEVYEEGIVRVRISKKEKFENFHYALDNNISQKSIDFLEKEDSIIISTGKVEVSIMKAPFRIVFRNEKGEIINEDDASFGTSWIGEQVTTYKKLQPNEKFIGLGEKTGPLNKKGRGYQNWNTDHFGYGKETDPLYCSIPFYIGIHSGMSYGIYLNNSYKSHFNFGASNNRFSSFSADAGDMDYFFIHHDSVNEIIGAYSRITGKMSLPPKWSLGYQQCRYSYYPEAEVLNTAQTFRDKEIPADVIVLDIHYMEKYKIFTWDKERFPCPETMIEKLKALGFKVVVMCDPGIKVEEGYHAYEDGINKDVFIKYPDGSNYEGEVWPGWCHFPDFTKPETRDWWTNQLKSYSDIGIEGFWNDMNEIATWGQSLPELIEFDFDGDKGSTRSARNIYGLMMAKSTWEGARKNLKGKRPFNLTRAGFAGIQKYAAVWTGDNVASDEHMLLGMRMLNSMGLSGIPFAGFDAGGFIGNASENLFARWISMAAFTPFFRGHSNVNTKSSEPWTHGEHTEEISRNYISLRYRLMPYVYSMFFEASESGTPVNRSLAIDYTHDENIYNEAYENEFLFGDSILVTPVSSEKEIEKIYFPAGEWYDLFTDTKYMGNKETLVECPVEKLPVFAKSSSIIPVQSQVYSLQEKPADQLEIHLYKGKEPCSFVYYEDDGDSYAFESGEFYKRTITYQPKGNQLDFSKSQGTFKSCFTEVKLYFHGFETIELKSVEIEQEDYHFISPLSNFDPIDNSRREDYKITNLPHTTFKLKNEEFSINWK
ncbi:alpha-glucosidase [Reichenbachiella faecimaris]|uniref:Alpha-glucosidase n=1 Tax=Reichenbachiella faecimaris TaxID=692418 RepID=A0A1W2GKS5_REIFA|nr:glycoside hydrolase family 31 protein [Reichenbachiella faecimaris]SMD37259.1 alpha-glucosidase [Reichenbachiella faecimaris]